MMANSAFQAYNDYATLSMIVNARLRMMYMLYGNLSVSGSLGNSAAILAQAYYF